MLVLCVALRSSETLEHEAQKLMRRRVSNLALPLTQAGYCVDFGTEIKRMLSRFNSRPNYNNLISCVEMMHGRKVEKSAYLFDRTWSTFQGLSWILYQVLSPVTL